MTTTTTTTTLQQTNVTSPSGGALTPQNFWGAMQSQGAPNIQGDAFMTKYATRTTVNNVAGGSDPDAVYDPNKYYNYGVEIPGRRRRRLDLRPGLLRRHEHGRDRRELDGRRLERQRHPPAGQRLLRPPA